MPQAKADLSGILDLLIKAGLLQKLLPYLPEILKLLAIFGKPGAPSEPEPPGFPDLPVVQPPLPEVPPDPGSDPAKLAGINLKIQWAADTQGNLRQDLDALAMGVDALNWACDIRFDTDLVDQYKNNFIYAPEHPNHDWYCKMVGPDGQVLGEKRIIAPDTVEGDGLPCRFGTGVYDKTNGFCLKMTFGAPANDPNHPLALRPLPGRWTAFIYCAIDGIESNEIPLKLD